MYSIPPLQNIVQLILNYFVGKILFLTKIGAISIGHSGQLFKRTTEDMIMRLLELNHLLTLLVDPEFSNLRFLIVSIIAAFSANDTQSVGIV